MSQNPNFRLRPSSKQLTERREQLRSGSTIPPANDTPSLQRQLQNLQTNGRLNELQSQLINLKNNVQLKFGRLSDPRTEFKAMVDREGNLNRQLAMKVEQLEESLYHTKESLRKNDEVVAATLLDFQKRLEVTEYRSRTTEKELEGVVNVFKKVKLRALTQPALPAPPISDPSGSAGELRLLREMLNQEKKNRDAAEQSLFRQHQALLEKHSLLEKEMYSLLSQQQQQQQKLLAANKQTEQQHHRAKSEQQGSELTAVRGLIGSVERKLQGEINTKLRSQSQLKYYIDGKTERIREELIMEQKTVLNSHASFMKESKESIESLFTLVMNNKQQWEQNLAATQSLIADNIKNLSKSIDVVRETLTKKLQGFFSNNQQTGNRYGQLRSKVVESLRAVDERLRQIEQRSQQAEQKLERQNSQAFEQILKKIEDEQLMTTNWKGEVQRKNLTIFKEISGTLKVLKTELAKQKQDSTQRDASRQKEMDAHQKNFSAELKKYIQGIITVFNNQFEVVVGELEILVQMINMSRTESEKTQEKRLDQLGERLREEMQLLTTTKNHQLAATIEKNISKASQQMVTRLLKQSTYLNELIAQKESTLSTQVAILSTEVRQSQLRVQSQQSAAREKHQQFIGQYKQAFADLQLTQAKLRGKLQQQVRSNTQSAIEIANQRNEFVLEGIRKAMELNAEKDKADLLNSVDQVRTQAVRSLNNLKYELTSELNDKLQVQRSERIDQQQSLAESVQTVDSNLRQSLALETSSIKVYVEEQLKATSNKLLQLNVQLSAKVTAAQNQLQQQVKRLDTQRYLDNLQQSVVLGQLHHNQQQHLQQLQLHQKQLQLHQTQLQKLKKLPQELDRIQQQFYQFDQNTKKLVEATGDRLTNMMYLDRNFTKVQLDDHEKTLVQILELVETVHARTQQNEADLEDTDNRFTDNFRVMEKAIKHTNEFLSVLDSRLTLEEIYSKVEGQQLWEQVARLTDQQAAAASQQRIEPQSQPSAP